jgi:phosphopantetheinyl transferase
MELYSEALNGRTGHEAGRALLKKLCGEREIALTDRGKPYFPDGGPCFSISHTKSRVFCALSDVPVGVDAEEKDRTIDLRLAQKILSPLEQEHFDCAPDKRLVLLKLWVLKEAHAKATGQGLRGYPNKTEFSPDDPRLSVVDGHVVAVIEMR